jgi:hypothetical protein
LLLAVTDQRPIHGAGAAANHRRDVGLAVNARRHRATYAQGVRRRGARDAAAPSAQRGSRHELRPAALRRLREKRGLRHDRLGELSGTTRRQLIAYEKAPGDKGRLVPGVDTVAALARAPAVDPFDLLAVTPQSVQSTRL